MKYTYKQYGTVALIFENKKAICTAKLEDGLWTAESEPGIGMKYRVLGGPGRPTATGRTLDELIASIREDA